MLSSTPPLFSYKKRHPFFQPDWLEKLISFCYQELLREVHGIVTFAGFYSFLPSHHCWPSMVRLSSIVEYDGKCWFSLPLLFSLVFRAAAHWICRWVRAWFSLVIPAAVVVSTVSFCFLCIPVLYISSSWKYHECYPWFFNLVYLFSIFRKFFWISNTSWHVLSGAVVVLLSGVCERSCYRCVQR